MVYYHRFDIVESISFEFTPSVAHRFYDSHFGTEYFDSVINHVCNGICHALIVKHKHGADTVKALRILIGPTNPHFMQNIVQKKNEREKEKEKDANSVSDATITAGTANIAVPLRALYGTDMIRNALHASMSNEAAVREEDILFHRIKRNVIMFGPVCN